MNAARNGEVASASEIRGIIGPCDDDLITQIIDVGPTQEEVLEAHTWLMSDDYMHRRLRHSLRGRAAQVFEILESAANDRDRP